MDHLLQLSSFPFHPVRKTPSSNADNLPGSSFEFCLRRFYAVFTPNVVRTRGASSFNGNPLTPELHCLRSFIYCNVLNVNVTHGYFRALPMVALEPEQIL